MKVLIFGIPKSGTSSLYKFLIDSFPKNYIAKYEPFKRTTEVEFGNDCIVKTVFSEDHDPILLRDGETIIEHSFRIIGEFDKVIYLKRKDLAGVKKSLSADSRVDEWNDLFDLISAGKRVYYYEELFTEDPSDHIYEICEYLEVDFNLRNFNNHIHVKNKYVKQKNSKTLI